MAKSATKPRLMIKGTEGNEDYLVIARQNGYVLGMKALMQLGGDASMFGFRLRMQKADQDPDTNVTDLPAKEKEVMVKTFENIPWGKRSLTRFSTVLTVSSGYGYDFRKQLLEETVDKLKGLVEDVEEKIAPVTLMNKTDCLAFMAEQYAGIVKKVEEYHDKSDGGGDGGDGDAEIIDFPGTDGGVDIE